mmetsp:Transcript_53366/g.155532  ORF Transcript_53366/g.155532 Transcript_53366/m.155532 type:complete len:308 (-) Transcript_53366:32-955(-)
MEGQTTDVDRPFPLLDVSSAQTLEWCRSLPPPPEDFAEDVFVSSYPKSGTTWMQHIVGSLVLRSRGKPPPSGHVSERTPFFEIDPHWKGPGQLASHVEDGHRAIGRRMFNTHLRWEMMPKNERTKYIYVCRDGPDACCSFFHHLSNQRTKAGDRFVFEGTFAEFHQRWVAGKIEFGRWTDHLASWDQAAGDTRVLFVAYEDMLANLRPCVERVAAHLNLVLSDTDFDELLPTFDFGHMKANADQFQPVSVSWKEGFQFLRKGAKGDAASLYGPTEWEAYARGFQERFAQGVPSWAPFVAPDTATAQD